MKPDKMISLVLGDESGDGHQKTENFNILSNLDKNDLLKAYKAATEKLGFNFIDEICEEYENRLCPKENLDILIKHGLKIDDLGLTVKYDLKEATDAFENDDSNGYSFWTESYVNVFLFIVKLGNKDFQIKILKGDLNPTINIGGYGLFE